jgi:Zn-dependent protease
MDGLSQELLRNGLIFFLLLFACLVLRAYAQAWTADRLGDPTPASEGRVTLYPVPHIDLLGTVILPLICIFYLQPQLGSRIAFFLAWAKPVPINPANFKNPRRDELLCQLASTLMSILLALGAAIVGGLLYRLSPSAGSLAIDAFGTLIGINAMLIVLDLLPIPPLPGGMILRHWGVISEEAYWQIARWGGLVLLILFQLPPVRALLALLVGIVGLPFGVIFSLIVGTGP